jgi:TonB family protein
MFEPFMDRKINKVLSMYLLLALCMLSVQSVQAWAGRISNQALLCLSNDQGSETDWRRVAPQGEEFSLLTPVIPALLKQGSNFYLHQYGEKVSEQRSYSAYADDFIFVIESYKAARPQKLLKDLEKDSNQRRTFERDITISGFSGKQYRIGSTDFHGKALFFVTRQHIYIITLAARDENNTAIAKFLSSLILGDDISAQASGQVLNLQESDAYKNVFLKESDAVQPQGQAFSIKDVSRKAIIIWRPEPTYTEQARHDQVNGTVVLRGVFDADGQVKNLRVMSGLGGGLTEKAVEAALSIRYFPAEKDGQRVSQYIQIEYNFNLY